MTLSIYIAIALISLGITADNLLLSKISFSTILFNKSGETLLLQIVLFTIQLQVLRYGGWFATIISSDKKEQNQWIAVLMLFSIGIKMLQEFKYKIIKNHKAYLDLSNYLNLVCATSIYVFVLGFALHLLRIDQSTIYKTVVPCLLSYFLIGWCLNQYSFKKELLIIKTFSVLMIFTGTTIFLINI